MIIDTVIFVGCIAAPAVAVLLRGVWKDLRDTRMIRTFTVAVSPHYGGHPRQVFTGVKAPDESAAIDQIRTYLEDSPRYVDCHGSTWEIKETR